MATKKQQKAIKKAQKGKALKQSVKKFEHERFRHGSDHDLIPDPDMTMDNAKDRMQVDGAGCFGGDADMESPVYKIRMIFVENPGKKFTAKVLCDKMGMKWKQLQKPLLMARQQGIVAKIKQGGLTFYEAGRSR